ncbi:hypothetical protein Tco_0491005 [Tanacetum coccineum]
MHNNFKAAGSKDRPPMLGPRKIFTGGDSPFLLPEAEVACQFNNITSLKLMKSIQLTVDACNTANEMWIAIERLQQGESLNVQDVKTNLFWEFGKFTSRDGESMKSYYSQFYKLKKSLTRKNLQLH